MHRALCLLGVSLVFCPLAQAGTVYSPDGSAYTSVSASTTFNALYTPDNLFDETPTPGVELSLGGSDAGLSYGGSVGAGPHYVEFEIDASNSIESLFYAQRDFNNTHNPTFDKVDKIELWISDTSPFTAADPSTTPTATFNIPASPDLRHDSDLFAEYPLTSPVIGRYFLVRLTGKPGEAGVIGGREMRVGIPEPASLGILAGTAVLFVGRRRRA
jgi:hypothetical protein